MTAPWDAMTKQISDVFDVPTHMIVTGSDEHLIPFGEVTWARLEAGIWHHVRDLRLSGAMDAFGRLPDGTLYMHPADQMDLLCSEPTQRVLYSPAGSYGNYGVKPWGYELVTTRTPSGAYGARRGRPRLHLNDGTDVLL